MGHRQHAGDKVPNRLDHETVHRGGHPAARGARTSLGRRRGPQASARRTGRLGEDHRLPPAHTYVRHPELHELPGVPVDNVGRCYDGEAGRAVSRQAARVRAGRENELQQLGVRAARLSDREDQREDLRAVPAGEHLRPARHDGLGLRLAVCGSRAPRGWIWTKPERSRQCAVSPYDHSARGRRAVFDDGGFASLESGALRREAAVGGIAREDDDTGQERLRVRYRHHDRQRPVRGMRTTAESTASTAPWRTIRTAA